jgi:alpha-ketoglutarate-dependent dioxygenase alkB family protein 2
MEQKLELLEFFIPQIKEINHLPELDIYYHQKFLPKQKANKILRDLLTFNYFSDERASIIIHGQKKVVPRKQMWYSDPKANYRFSGNEMKEQVWPSLLYDIRIILNEFIKDKGFIPSDSDIGLNSVLVNYYRNGNDYIGWHSDKIGDLIQIQGQTIIVSLTFGVMRPFILRRKDDHSRKYSINLAHGDLLIIKGKTNDYWQHSVPKRTTIKKPRINLTFRLVKSL